VNIKTGGPHLCKQKGKEAPRSRKPTLRLTIQGADVPSGSTILRLLALTTAPQGCPGAL